jgi:hypothetical protein
MKRLNIYTIWLSMLLLGVAFFIAYMIIHFSQVRAYVHQYNLGGDVVIVWLVLVVFKEVMVMRKRVRREVKEWSRNR